MMKNPKYIAPVLLLVLVAVFILIKSNCSGGSTQNTQTYVAQNQVKDTKTNVAPNLLKDTLTYDDPKSLPVQSGRRFMIKPEVSGATVITRTEQGWKRDDASCDGDQSFVKANYNSPGGPMTLFVHPAEKDKYVSKAIIDGGIWERDFVKKIYKLFVDKPFLQFLDIGGNIGIFGMAVAKLGNEVVLVEPQLTNVRKLCHSRRANKFKDVYVIHNALSSERTRVGFTPKEGNIGAYRVRNVTSQEEESAYAALLDDILDVFNFTTIVMKMDVETHEHKVLQAAEKFFSKVDVRYILMEWHHDKKKTGGPIVDFLTRHDMVPFHPRSNKRLDPKEFLKWFGDIFWRKMDR